MKLSVLMPVYNEEAGLETILRRVTAVGATRSGEPIDKEIIVVDDCSSDGTAQILENIDLGLGTDSPTSRGRTSLRVIRHLVNSGKGVAIRTAIQAATGDAVIIQDADLEYDPQDYVALLEPILDGRAPVVYGVRNLDEQKLLFRLGNKILTLLTNLLYGVRLHDMETCYKVMTAEVAKSLQPECNRFDLEPEITAKVIRQGYEIHEVPISYHPREEIKLSPWRDGLPAVLALFRYRRWKPSARHSE